jgi:hypothetical protein
MDKTITLEAPIRRGETNIDTLALRKPKSGELRGLNVADILQMNVDATIKLLPRISIPTLTEQEAAQLDAADLTQVASAVAGFFLPKSALQ